MMKRMMVTLALDVEATNDPEDAGEPADAYPFDEYEVTEIAQVLEGLGEPHMADELFAGTMVFAKFTACRVLSSFWEDVPSPSEPRP